MMMTDDSMERNAARLVKVHRLSDPLAAMGQRSPTPRIRQERNARVALLVLTLTATLAITGAIAALSDPAERAPSQEPFRVLTLPDDDDRVDVRSTSS